MIESPTEPPTIAPRTTAKFAPTNAAIAKIPVSIVPNTISAPVDLIVLPENFKGIQGINPNKMIIGPSNVVL